MIVPGPAASKQRDVVLVCLNGEGSPALALGQRSKGESASSQLELGVISYWGRGGCVDRSE